MYGQQMTTCAQPGLSLPKAFELTVPEDRHAFSGRYERVVDKRPPGYAYELWQKDAVDETAKRWLYRSKGSKKTQPSLTNLGRDTSLGPILTANTSSQNEPPMSH